MFVKVKDVRNTQVYLNVDKITRVIVTETSIEVYFDDKYIATVIYRKDAEPLLKYLQHQFG